MAVIEKPPQWVKADELKNYDNLVFKILTEAKPSEGNYGTEVTCEILVIIENDSERAKWRINDKSRIALIDAYGADSTAWMGEEFPVVIDTSTSKPSIIAQPKK